MKHPEIHIIGAGPAGLTAALTLAREGLHPIVFEKARNVGSRFNGDFQGLENWSTKEEIPSYLESLGIEINFRCEPFSKGIFYGPGLVPLNVETTRTWFFLVERGSGPDAMDQGLKQQVLDAGVEIRFGEKIEHATADKVIVATGPRAADAIARGIIFTTSHPDACFGFLDDQIAPRGYAYLLIHRGRATLATCLFDNFAMAHVYLERTLSKVRDLVGMDVQDPRAFGGYVNFAIRESWSRENRLFFVGERAGFQDALWGFGLRYAMQSGYLAARAILDDSSYDDLCRENIIPRTEASVANRMLFSQLGNHGYDWMLGRLKSIDVMDALIKHHQPTRWKELLYQIAKRRVHPALRELSCGEVGCSCLWCSHGKEMNQSEMDRCIENVFGRATGQ